MSSSLSSSIIKHNFTGVVSLVADSQSSAYALCGLLAFGTFQTHGDSLADWHSLFALEGSLAVYMVIVAFIFLPYSAGHAKFLTEDEKELALYRMQVDSSSVSTSHLCSATPSQSWKNQPAGSSWPSKFAWDFICRASLCSCLRPSRDSAMRR